jgi:hypothetical protein
MEIEARSRQFLRPCRMRKNNRATTQRGQPMKWQDPDDMPTRKPHDAPFKPSPPNVLPVWTVVLVVTLAVVALFKRYENLLEPQPQSPTVHRPSPNPQTLAPPAPAAAPAPEPARPWVRCTVNGKTLYLDTECPSADASGHAKPQERQPSALPSPATTTTMYLCKAYNGGTFWASSHCNQHQALVDRMVNVPSHLPFDQKMALAESNRRAALQAVPAQPKPPAASRTKPNECQQLNQQIVHWDSMARQPQSAQTQDWIRTQRQQIRDRQFALRC